MHVKDLTPSFLLLGLLQLSADFLSLEDGIICLSFILVIYSLLCLDVSIRLSICIEKKIT